MTEIIELKKEKPVAFLEMITEAGQESFMSDSGFVLGLLSDGYPAGAIALDIRESTAYITSLYIRPEYRRQGLGTELIYEACTELAFFEGVYSMDARFAVNEKDGAGLREFFEEIGFDLSPDGEHGAYSFSLKDAVESEIIEKAPDNNIIHYRDADPEIKNRLIAAHPSLKYIISHHEIEQDISCFVCGKRERMVYPTALSSGKRMMSWL